MVSPRQRLAVGVLLLLIGVAGCGGSTNRGTSATVAGSSSKTGSSSTASAKPILIAVAEVPTGGYNAGPTPVRFMQPDGKEVGRVTVKQGVTEVAAAAGSRVFVLEENGILKAVHRDGSVEDLGNLGDRSPSRFTVSPDGHRWMWGTFDGQTSQVHLAGDGLAPRVVAESHGNERAIQPYAWTPVGAFLVDSPVGIGGYILFNPAPGPVRRVDLTSFTTSPVAYTDHCAFSDMSRDGTIACFPPSANQNSRSLSLIAPNGSARTIQLAMPRFAQDGGAYFSADGSQLTVGGATSAGTSGQPEQYGTDVVTTKDASIRRLSTDGVRPSDELRAGTWLDDGSLIVWRPDDAAGGPPGVFVVSASGKVTQLGGRGMPIGLMSG